MGEEKNLPSLISFPSQGFEASLRAAGGGRAGSREGLGVYLSLPFPVLASHSE